MQADASLVGAGAVGVLLGAAEGSSEALAPAAPDTADCCGMMAPSDDSSGSPQQALLLLQLLLRALDRLLQSRQQGVAAQFCGARGAATVARALAAVGAHPPGVLCGLDGAGLGWAGLGWAGLGWAGLGWLAQRLKNSGDAWL